MSHSLSFFLLCLCILVIVLATCSAALELLELHGPDGQRYYVNPEHISSLRQPTRSDAEHYFPRHVRCVVVTDNGKFIAAVETCDDIRNRLTR